MNILIYGILLGWGAAAPIGPVNIEIIRRNLCFGTHHGLALGFGACLADLSYLILLSIGALFFLQQTSVLQVVGVLGSLLLLWFAWQAFKREPASVDLPNIKKPSLVRNSFEGYIITFLNPYTILFWATISSQITTFTTVGEHSIVYAAIGIMIGVTTWVIFINLVMHYSQHYISQKAMLILNRLGGIILLLFASLSLFWIFKS